MRATLRIGRSATALAIVLIAGMLTGCNDVGQQKRMAEAGTRQFQKLYNSGSCLQVYDEASTYFQEHETRERWLRDCDQLRRTLGRWTDFSAQENNSWIFGEPGIVWIRGAARFESGPARVRLDWSLANGRVGLSNILIETRDTQISVPGFGGERRN